MLEFGRRLRNFWWRPSVDDEVEAEVAFHLAMRTREFEAAGMPPDEARRAALARLGDLDRMRHTLRTLGAERDRMNRQREWFGELAQDVRYAWRSLRQQPGFTLAALLTLGLGIGGATAIFSLVYAVVLRPLPIPDLPRVMVVGDGQTSDPRGYSVSVGNYTDYQRETRAFAVLGATWFTNVNLNVDASPERVPALRANAEFFAVMRIPPAAGRVYTAAEDQPGGARVVVISDGLWRRRFGADPGVVGRTILLDGSGYEVIGIMPPRFPLGSEELWLPAAFTAAQRAQHDEHFLEVYGRLKPGVTVAQALADQNRIAARLREAYQSSNHALIGSVQPMFSQFVGNAPERLGILFGAVLVVLLIGCANVANLLLARGTARERELALRAALGAGRGRIVRQLVTENLVLATVAGLLGIGLAAVVVRGVVAAAPSNLPRLAEAGLDPWVLLFALGISLGSVLIFGLVPALRSARPDMAQALREGSRGSAGTNRDWLRRGLVAAEFALALVLLVGAGLLVRTAINLGRIDPGFRPEGVLSARVGLPVESYPEWQQVTDAFTRLNERLAQTPGAEAAGLSSQVPLGPGGGENGLVPEGRPIEAASAIGSRLRIVTPGYLAGMGIPLIKGRDFTPDDRRGNPRVMIVTRRLAEVAWPGQDPIGKRITCCEGSLTDPMWKEVIGVAGDVRSGGVDEEPRPEFYLPVTQAPEQAWNWIQRTMTVVVRGRNPAALTGGIRDAVKTIDPTVPVYAITTMDQRIAQSLADSRFNTRLLTALGLIGLVLSAIGIYGVIGYFVTRQARELGIRMALGASAADIRRLVLAQGLAPAAIGLGVGTVGALLVTRVLASQLRGVGASDPVTFGVVVVLLGAVAVVATLVPAGRATRVDPTTAMRED